MSIKKYNFRGGDYLATIGASWFVSYLYHNKITSLENRWKNVKTYQARISNFNNTKILHKSWLEQILNMNDDKLDTNEIKITATEVKEMANNLLKLNEIELAF